MGLINIPTPKNRSSVYVDLSGRVRKLEGHEPFRHMEDGCIVDCINNKYKIYILKSGKLGKNVTVKAKYQETKAELAARVLIIARQITEKMEKRNQTCLNETRTLLG